MVMSFAKENLKDKKVYNKSIKKSIELNWQGLKHDISSSYQFYEDKLHSISRLRYILRNAELFEKVPNEKGCKTGCIYKMTAKIKVSGTEYDVWIVVKETGKRFFYDHGLLLQ